jgi:hypothetical protein
MIIIDVRLGDMSRLMSFFAWIRGIWRFGFSWARTSGLDALLAGFETGWAMPLQRCAM